jgi:Uma2 family endonuclease
MSTATLTRPKRKIEYPDSDGQPMSDNTVQFRWIQTLQGGLDALFREDPLVFVAGDLLWYPVEGDNTAKNAPDVMAVFGRPKGDRGSYRQWEEEGIAPQVAFEIVSPGNRAGQLDAKLEFYDRFGVEEYYLYDPDSLHLRVWIRQQGRLQEIAEPDGWVSPRLGVRFDLSCGVLRVLRPDGRPLVSYVELAEETERQRQRAEGEHRQAERERQRAEREHQQAEQERQRAEQEQQRAERERQRSERLAAQLRAVGIEPEP